MNRRPRIKNTPWDNAEIREVRRWKARLLKKAGGTVQGLVDLVAKRQAEREQAASKQVAAKKKAVKRPSNGRSRRAA